MPPKVVVAMSGGVDSSVVALLLKNQGYDVVGMFMKNWDEKDPTGMCQSTADFEHVVKVCEKLDIPYYSVNFTKEYWDLVFVNFIEELKLGFTPNPDILCNKEIKFKMLLDKALKIGADFLATGHYCRIEKEEDQHLLLKGSDVEKDQSYFLYTLKSEILPKILFPIGDLNKKEVRRLAKEHQLATWDKKDSTGICFIGERNFREFLGQHLSCEKGNFENSKGEIIGTHEGLPFYTIGQRKGIKIGGKGDAWFVIGKDPKRNVVIIEQGKNNPLLFAPSLIALEASWINSPPLSTPFKCKAKIRYRQEDQACCIEKIEGNQILVSFEKPQRAITPRQSIVFYKDNVCLGGALILSEKKG